MTTVVIPCNSGKLLNFSIRVIVSMSANIITQVSPAIIDHVSAAEHHQYAEALTSTLFPDNEWY